MTNEPLVDQVPITDLFDQFIEASTLRGVLSIYQRILKIADLQPCEFNVFFPKLKKAITAGGAKGNWKAKALLSKIHTKSTHKCYSNPKATSSNNPLGTKPGDSNCRNSADESFSSQSSARNYQNNNALQHHNCLVIGSGPAGLRTAIELQLLGANRVVIVEKRTRFSRNNVLHLWPFVIDDLKSLGAKKFYGKFCAGSIDHISIRQLQLILLKICLMIGCNFKDNCSYQYLCPSSIKRESASKNGKSTTQTQVANFKCDLEIEGLNQSSDLGKNSDSLPSVQLVGGNSETWERLNNSKSETSISALEPEEDQKSKLRGARAHFECESKKLEKELHDIKWDVIIGADGRRNSWNRLFERKELRGKLAIAITANFINHRTDVENSVAEIPGLSYMYYQDKFNALAFETGIQLENICYYKDDTHYFVMTAKKSSLLCRGVLKNDCANAQDLLSASNVDRQALLTYATDAASWTTGLEPPLLEFASNHHGEEDCAMFDFTSMYAAQNACRALRTKGDGLCLIGLVGDSLLEPFWPTGSGCARGFLSSFDAAWMCRQWSVNRCACIETHRSSSSRQGRNRTSSGNRDKPSTPATYDKMALNVLAERESIYRILNQTTSESLQAHYRDWELNPHTRYRQLNRQFVTPNQVAYLLGEGLKPETGLSPRGKNKLSIGVDKGRKLKSPNNINSRKSPKKLKSADASPVAQPKNYKSRSKSLTKYAYASRDQGGFELDETYLEFEESYRNLANINRRSDRSDSYIPYISGSSPSSNNLHNLEAGRVRELDECMRQRRQTKKINVVCKELIEQFRNNTPSRDRQSANRDIRRDSTIFQELRRECELKFRDKENRPKSISNPLTLFNSVNRSASFAARLQTFEHRPKSFCEPDSPVTTPRTPIDNVKNLPQFATLQELFVNNSAQKVGEKKSHVPVAKISKDDWNFKCWEERLASEKQTQARNLAGSTRSLNKVLSVDSYHAGNKSNIKDEVFKDRVKDMAGKLRIAKDETKKLRGNSPARKEQANKKEVKTATSGTKYDGKPQGEWVRHLKSELTKGSSTKLSSTSFKQPMNPSLPGKPIKKLFEEEEEDNKHYDHLCVNRPSNSRLLLKNTYSSHLVRTKYDSATSKVINTKPSTASKQAYVAGLTSRGSSASSTLSDYSTNTGHSSSGSMRQNNNENSKCFRCDKLVNFSDKITIGHANLHLNCLNCAQCGITLRMDELHHYLSIFEGLNETLVDKCFNCAICKPDIRIGLASETSNSLMQQQESGRSNYVKSHMKSREEFLSAPIDYNTVYKNLLDDDKANINEVREIIGRLGSSSRETTPSISTGTQSNGYKSRSSQDYEDAVSRQETVESLSLRQDQSRVSPSPTKVTLPMKLVTDYQQRCKKPVADYESLVDSNGYKIARSETVDGSEQVTLILSDDSTSYTPVTTVNERASFTSKSREMIDEDEFERRLNSGNSLSQQQNDESCKKGKKSTAKTSSGSSLSVEVCGLVVESNSGESCSREDTSDENDGEDKAHGDSDNSSSLPSTDEFEDEESNDNVDSTYDDFATSEEFDSTSEREEYEEALVEAVEGNARLEKITGQSSDASQIDSMAADNAKKELSSRRRRSSLLEHGAKPTSVPS